jgi:hypothetical protein
MMKTESGLTERADALIRKRKKSYRLLVGWVAFLFVAAVVFTLLGVSPFSHEGSGLLRPIFFTLLFLPIGMYALGTSFFQAEMEEASAQQYAGPPQSPFTLSVPSRVGQPGRWFTVAPLFIFGAVLALVIFLFPVLSDMVMNAGGSFMVFNLMVLGAVLLVIGVGVWMVRRTLVSNKKQREFTGEFAGALLGAGFMFAREGYQIYPEDYEGEPSIPLKDSNGLVSRWNLSWSGEVATLTPAVS